MSDSRNNDRPLRPTAEFPVTPEVQSADISEVVEAEHGADLRIEVVLDRAKCRRSVAPRVLVDDRQAARMPVGEFGEIVDTPVDHGPVPVVSVVVQRDSRRVEGGQRREFAAVGGEHVVMEPARGGHPPDGQPCVTGWVRLGGGPGDRGFETVDHGGGESGLAADVEHGLAVSYLADEARRMRADGSGDARPGCSRSRALCEGRDECEPAGLDVRLEFGPIQRDVLFTTRAEKQQGLRGAGLASTGMHERAKRGDPRASGEHHDRDPFVIRQPESRRRDDPDRDPDSGMASGGEATQEAGCCSLAACAATDVHGRVVLDLGKQKLNLVGDRLVLRWAEATEYSTPHPPAPRACRCCSAPMGQPARWLSGRSHARRALASTSHSSQPDSSRAFTIRPAAQTVTSPRGSSPSAGTAAGCAPG